MFYALSVLPYLKASRNNLFCKGKDKFPPMKCLFIGGSLNFKHLKCKNIYYRLHQKYKFAW